MLLQLLSGAVVGVSLGLTGGGGSILAVPLLLHVVGMDLRAAVKASLAVVGLTSLLGAWMQRSEVVWRAGLVLGVGGIAGAPLGAFLGGYFPDQWVLILFSGLMLFIAYRFWKGAGATEVPIYRFSCRREPGETSPPFRVACAAKLGLAGVAAGVLAGLFGVGGGFLLVPALVVIAGLPLGKALATSLPGIALLSGAGFYANWAISDPIAFETVTIFLAGALGGMVLGTHLKPKIPAEVLKKIFAVMITTIAVAMVWKSFSA